MNKKDLMIISLYCCAAVLLSLPANAQSEKCGTMLNREQFLLDPINQEHSVGVEVKIQQWITKHKGQKTTSTINIPVVVHVVYNTNEENISDAQIQSQLDVLNLDFRNQNTDALTNGHAFFSDAANSQIEFCLATQDPNGNTTTGITRTQTNMSSFSGNGEVKASASGGIDNWDPSKYLNIWVCNISGGTLGFAAFPDELAADPELDGVVITYQAFGTEGTAGTGGFDVNDMGRTATHEVGHWLNLYHIWGDANCGDDFVSDTPLHEQENYDCPTFPFNANNTCGTGVNGEMYMNYMDYVDDNCMVMFTNGQSTRMTATLNTERASLLNSTGCNPSTSMDEISLNPTLKLVPNPTNGPLEVTINNIAGGKIILSLLSITGQVLHKEQITGEGNGNIYSVRLDNQEDGIYLLRATSETMHVTQRVVIRK